MIREFPAEGAARAKAQRWCLSSIAVLTHDSISSQLKARSIYYLTVSVGQESGPDVSGKGQKSACAKMPWW